HREDNQMFATYLKARHAGRAVSTYQRRFVLPLAVAALVAGCASTGTDTGARRATIPDSVKTVESNVARQGYFYVGGHYVGDAGREAMIGQMYVEVWAPREVRHPYPIVF